MEQYTIEKSSDCYMICRDEGEERTCPINENYGCAMDLYGKLLLFTWPTGILINLNRKVLGPGYTVICGNGVLIKFQPLLLIFRRTLCSNDNLRISFLSKCSPRKISSSLIGRLLWSIPNDECEMPLTFDSF